MTENTIRSFPKSRIATIDICELGKHRHHVTGILEVDVTESREKIKLYRKRAGNISFTAWMVKVIAHTVHNHKQLAGFLKGKQQVFIFDDIDVSFLVEKEINGEPVPVPLLLKKVNEASMESITKKLMDSKNELLTEDDLVLHRKTTAFERLYTSLPGFLRRAIWRFMLKRPGLIFSKMGNVAITSLGMAGKINGWFIPISIHPACFGLGPVIKKPVVKDDQIVIREIMNLTVLLDHDVIDGAPMARFIVELTKNIEGGIFL
jgi:pyruvate/2-oxoglutarate dehydrogenase complex dihydrolipoamide acyltransferase (E2) component